MVAKNPYIKTVEAFTLYFDERLILELADDKKTGNIGDTKVVTIVETALDGAAQEADNKLRTAYALPIQETATNTLDEVKQIVADLAKVRLYARKPPMSVEITDLAVDARARLTALTDGTGDAQVGSGLNAQTAPKVTSFNSEENQVEDSPGLTDSVWNQGTGMWDAS